MQLAPIVLFVYNRPQHAARTLEALSLNELADQSILYIYADGPKDNSLTADLDLIKKTRQIIRSAQWCKEVFIIESEQNKGLANSIINGVTEVVNKYGKVIVLEDDLITSKYFLTFMNDALDMYIDEQNVLSIGALNFFATDKEIDDTFFIPIPDCWGWATWQNRWQLFEPNSQKLLNQLRENNLINKFNLYGAYNFENMLEAQIKGHINSWAVRWQAVAYLNNMLNLYPKYSVTYNIGFGHEGTHGADDVYSKRIKFAHKKINVNKIAVKENPNIIKKMLDGYAKISERKISAKVKLQIKQYLKLLAPPLISSVYQNKKKPRHSSMWHGDFANWDSAKDQCIGYDSAIILEKTKNAILKVKNGEAAGERDSVLFDKPDFNWPVLTTLLKAATENNGRLSILDFGGSLGSSYFQNRDFLQSINHLQWSVVEQPNYINVGNDLISDSYLKFYPDIATCLNERKPNVLLLSSVLQYIAEPYVLLAQLIKYNFDYIIIDRTAFLENTNDNHINRLTVQQVPEDIYPASYPAWFFDVTQFLSAFKNKYKKLADFEPYPGLVIDLDPNTKGYYKGFIFKKEDHS